MLRYIPIALVILFLAGCVAVPKPDTIATASNVSQCGPIAAVKAQLQERYQEYPRAIALAMDGQYMLELFARADGGTYTIVLMKPGQDRACMLIEGSSWSNIPLSSVEEGT